MLVQHLVKTLGVDYAFIGKLIGNDNNRVRTVAVCIRGEISENFEYDLADTPCQNIIESSPCYYQSDIQQLFPKDKMLTDMGAESYIGAPLFDFNDHVMGLMAILHTKSLTNINVVKSVFQISAARVAAEMERIQIGDALEEKTKSLANAQRIARLGNWDLDIVNNRLYWSDEIYRIFGAKPQEFGATYEAFLGFVHPDDMESVKKAVNESLYDRKPYSIHHRIVLPEGGERIVHEQAEVVFDEQGKPVKMSGTVQDITEWKKAEEGHSLLSAAVAQSTDCVVITDLDGTIVYVNPAFERNTGYSAAQAIGKKPNILKSEKHSSEYYSKLWFALKSRGSWSGILINKRKDGTLFEEETNISTVSDSKGRPAYYVAVKRDVTNERRLEEQLRHAQKMEAIGELTGGIAHDFNNFLTAILGFSSLLQMKLENDKDAQSNSYLQNIISAADKAANMTNSLLSFSRKRIINIRPALLNDIISGIEKLLQRVITENVELKTALTDKGTIIMADTGQIEQVLLNLVANARDAMSKGGTVFIKTEIMHLDEAFVGTYGYGKSGAYVLLSVSDTGIGMDETTKERIFEPFFTTKEAGKGTGLGLSIVYGIIRQHNGYIEVNSESGKGTTFNIYLPIIESTIESTEIKKEAVPKGGTETILLAEDELEVRRLVKTVLEEFGYKVIEAVDGADAVDRFMENKDKINLIMLDVIMPKKNGREAYNKIKNIKSDVKTIFISGYTEDIIKREDIFEMGLNFISKPVSPSDLLKKIREVIDK